MIQKARQAKLMDLLQDKEVMSVTDLSERLNSSKMTIRRDLEYLEQKGIVRKVHGGAVLLKLKSDTQPSFESRFDEFAEEKTRIGQAAARMITPDSVICIDAGTSTLTLVEYIPNNLQCTVITPALMTAMSLCKKPDVSIIHIGGSVHHSSYSSCGSMTAEFIGKFNADIAFISTKSISVPEGTFESYLPLIEVKTALISIAKRVVLLADHSKFDGKSLCLAVPMEKIDCVITDNGTDVSAIDALRNIGKEVIVV